MDWLLYVVAAFFVIAGAACVLLVAINLPGTWIMLALAVLIELLDGLYLTADPPVTFGWRVIGVCVALAIIGEILEFISGALGTKYGGGTRRGMIGAIIGGIIGAIVFTPIIPIPLIGTLIGALIGTFAGAAIGEITAEKPQSLRGSIIPASGATLGRILGTVGKAGIAVVMWLVLSVAAFWA
jgi:uncharacterized protein